MKETAAAPKHLPSHGVYVIEGEGEKAFWTKVGSAWAHGDGNGYNVQLSALPISGRLVLRVRSEKEGDE
ncbi:hypothetical protein FJ934_08560 [Mesorhizobium sp. B2-4-12]|uniref:hypothetical protein n=1 Tax=Mesorhizobium sp. B2-4-12 TaxID=2589937 RepID=UPI00112E4CD5|nr:hypothetical protein [Mesorhizobium sp. B2-4-12]TPK96603.1 hypothetical protein FJ934_08560 [Mesorhizobium sp. B2-4-12]